MKDNEKLSSKESVFYVQWEFKVLPILKGQNKFEFNLILLNGEC